MPETEKQRKKMNKNKEQPITLLDILQEQKARKYSGGIYHKTQIDLTYNSNRIEGSRLTYDQTRDIFETNKVCVETEALNVDDVIETVNHFRCIDLIIDRAKAVLTEKFIKELQGLKAKKRDRKSLNRLKGVPKAGVTVSTYLKECRITGAMMPISRRTKHINRVEPRYKTLSDIYDQLYWVVVILICLIK